MNEEDWNYHMKHRRQLRIWDPVYREHGVYSVTRLPSGLVKIEGHAPMTDSQLSELGFHNVLQALNNESSDLR